MALDSDGLPVQAKPSWRDFKPHLFLFNVEHSLNTCRLNNYSKILILLNIRQPSQNIFPPRSKFFPGQSKQKMETKQSTKENHYGLSKIRHRPHNNQEGVLNE